MSDERTALAELATQATATLLTELVAHLRQNRTQLREEWVAPHHGRPAPDGDEPRGDLRRGHVGLRQLRGGAGDGDGGSAPGLCPQSLRAHHSPGRRDERGRGHRAPSPRRAGAVTLRQVPWRRGPAEPRARRLRARRQPHRDHRGRRLRPAARAGHSRAAGSDPASVDPGACRSASACSSCR